MTEAVAVVGWDIGGAHVKACLLQGGHAQDIAQWACPLWLGLDRLQQVLDTARARWPGLDRAAHSVTMTGEMVDLFAQREDGVGAIADTMAQAFPRVVFYAGDAGWCTADQAAPRWAQIASANWLAAATLAARRVDAGLLVDIGSTTTDLIAFARGRVLAAERSDAERLASGALVYHGVVRTPLCAVAQRIPFRGREHNVMNEFFATSADVYRLTGELDPAHDLQPSADQGPKTPEGTRTRLARMIGLDARDAGPAEWLSCAEAWRGAQLREIGGQLARVLERHALPADAPLLAAGCGAFLAARLHGMSSAASARPFHAYASRVCSPALPARLVDAAQVCAPAVAVAMLHAQDKEL